MMKTANSPLSPAQAGLHRSLLSRRRAALFVCTTLLTTPIAFAAERAENPIPASGGALRFDDSSAETDAFDAGWKGENVCELLIDNEEMRAARCAFPPGVGHERHRHAPHWGYVVEGSTMRITDKGGTNERAVKAGDSWWSDGILWHEVVNIGKTTGVYIIVEPKGAER